MGTRVEFWLGSTTSLEEAIIDGMVGFRSWCEELATKPDYEIPIETVNLADAIIANGAEQFYPNNVEAARKLDHLVELYIGYYCDSGPGRTLFPSAHNSMLPVRYFESSVDVIKVNASATLLKWWTYIFTGRPVARNPDIYPYVRVNSVFRTSFAEHDEINQILQQLRFLSISNIDVESGNAIRVVKEALAYAKAQNRGLIITVA